MSTTSITPPLTFPISILSSSTSVCPISLALATGKTQQEIAAACVAEAVALTLEQIAAQKVAIEEIMVTAAITVSGGSLPPVRQDRAR
jgi:hypothetical protein